ncbi:MAG: hypothetical protein ISS36_00585 [Candidatus Aenigmarchaeota archaeon]|nr:hypothetical protein [Candidatus Aenigmarchaeota archaeon]
MKVLSGSQAVAEAVKLCKPEVVPVYPITPATPMAEYLSQMVADGDLNAEFITVESEHSAMSACIGASSTGVRTFTATASQGLCVTPDTDIIMENPGIKNIKDFVDKNLEKYKINQGKWEIGTGTGKILTWNGQEFEYDKITHVQRIKPPKKLIKIITRSGSEVTVTPDHKILIDNVNKPEWIEAKMLNGNEYLYAPRKIKLKNIKRPKIIEFLPENMTVILDSEIKTRLVRKIKNIYGSLNKGSKKLEIPKHHILSNYSISLETIKKLCDSDIIKWKEIYEKTNIFSLHGGTIKTNFKELNKDFMYLLGLMFSDGCFKGDIKSKNRFVFTNKNKKLLKIFSNGYKKLFPNKPVGKVLLKRGVTQLMGSNFIFSILGKKITLKKIFSYDEELIKSFLKGYFDGDGSCRIQSKKRITIFLHCKDDSKVSDLKKLLLRLGILSHVYKRDNIIRGLYICGLGDTIKFISTIGSNHPQKRERFVIAKKFLLKSKPRPQWSGKTALICRDLLIATIKKSSYSMNEIDPENYINKTKFRNTRIGKEKLREILKRMEERNFEKDETFSLLKKMSSDSFFLDPIKKIKKIKSPHKYVYDLTVEKNRSFVPNAAFVVSNCLMHEMLFVASGTRLPIVMAIANRALSAPLNIWNDQQDSFAQRDSGWIQLYVENAQEAFDTIIMAYRIAEEMKTPAMVCMDGYVISHTYENVELLSQSDVDRFLPKFKPEIFLNPRKPMTIGPVGTPEYYMEFKKQQQDALKQSLETIKRVSNEFASMVKRKYGNGLIEKIGMEGKKHALITIGSLTGTARALQEQDDFGIIRIKALRPFPLKQIIEACKDLESVGVVEKDISLGANGVLYDEIRSALYGKSKAKVSGYIAGLGGKDITLSDLKGILKSVRAGKDSVEWI